MQLIDQQQWRSDKKTKQKKKLKSRVIAVKVESQVLFNYVESSQASHENLGLESESSLESCDSSPHPWVIHMHANYGEVQQLRYSAEVNLK